MCVRNSIATSHSWEIGIRNASNQSLNSLTVQASQSRIAYKKGNIFKKGLFNANGFSVNIPPEGIISRTVNWNKMKGAKTLKFTLSWQGSTRDAYLDLSRKYVCISKDIRNPQVPFYIKSIHLYKPGTLGYKDRVEITFHNPTSELIQAIIHPWERGPNGDAVGLLNYQHTLLPQRDTKVSYNFNSTQGTEEFGVTYRKKPSLQSEVSRKVICKNSGGVKMTPKTMHRPELQKFKMPYKPLKDM